MTWTGLLTVVLAAMVAIGCNNPRVERDAVGTAGEETVASAGDRDFVDSLTIANMAEVDLGSLAKDRATSAEVKQFAEMMVTDHTKAGDELKQIAQRHRIPTPGQLDEKHRDLRMKLSDLSGAEFDREYMAAMVQGHEDVVDKLQTRTDEDRTGADRGTVEPEANDNSVEAGLNLFAARALPTTRKHLEEARRIQDALESTRQTSR